MSQRENKNKHTNTRRTPSDQGDEGLFIADGNEQAKRSHTKKETGGSPSAAESKKVSQDANRDHSVKEENDR